MCATLSAICGVGGIANDGLLEAGLDTRVKIRIPLKNRAIARGDGDFSMLVGIRSRFQIAPLSSYEGMCRPLQGLGVFGALFVSHSID